MRRARTGGFTLPELTAVLLLAAILATVALPRMLDRGGFAARGAADFIASSMRYAQKSAIAMRRNVCVTVGTERLAISVAADAGSAQPCAAALADPATGWPFDSRPYDGGATVATPATLVFDALGRPLASPGVALAAPLALTVNGHAAPIRLEPETGYVH
ncbi:MAG TPA: prepilin-type N-terminal cleavage/methylation domain-containing protein [Albitalea sp.]